MEAVDFRNGTGDYAGNAFNTSFGALYYPWLLINDPVTGNPRYLVPPSGAAAGTFSHVDTVRGVHKAPAGTPDGYLDSANGIERIVTKAEHDMLNPIGINVIRKFPASGICIWGARTLSADPEWKYINIRRLFLYLEESIDLASQWVVFEPNSPSLWGSVTRNITAFLLMVWRSGALFGNTPEEAFFVKVDAENNPEEVRNVGQLIIEVGVAPVRPAEFVIIRISQKTLAK
jgi:phage tail sheath protein FI